jgi:hypothetical protein
VQSVLEVIYWNEMYGNSFLDLRRMERVWNSSCGNYNREKTQKQIKNNAE